MTFRRETSGAWSRISSGSMAGFDVDVAGAALHGAQQDRIQELDGRALIFSGMIEREDFLAAFVLFDQDRSVFGFELAQGLARTFAAFQGGQNRRLWAHHQLQLPAEEQFQLIKAEQVLGIGNGDSETALHFRDRNEGMALHQLD